MTTTVTDPDGTAWFVWREDPGGGQPTDANDLMTRLASWWHDLRGQAWTVVARSEDGQSHRWRISGRAEADQWVTTVSEGIGRGVMPPTRGRGWSPNRGDA